MKIDEIKQIVIDNSNNLSSEYRRLFHGRGALYEGFEYLLIDSINDILFITFFKESDDEEEILNLAKFLFDKNSYKACILQKRYIFKAPSEVIFGELNQKENHYVYELGLKYKINLLSNQNFGFFCDMKVGHKYILDHSKDKNVLNLFSYTCAFSLCAIKGQASKVVNVDMSKSALTTGRENHRINDLDTKKVKFMPYNILKSWNRIKKEGPYDVIVIDPPSFQKGSFAASNDYIKIIKKLNTLAAKNCTILSCLNAPELDTQFIKDLFSEYAPEFKFIKRLDNMDTHKSLNLEKALKNLIFEKKE